MLPLGCINGTLESEWRARCWACRRPQFEKVGDELEGAREMPQEGSENLPDR